MVYVNPKLLGRSTRTISALETGHSRNVISNTPVSVQVSHHPPVTALAMFHAEEGLDAGGNVSFSVKFHGNSVSVNTVGGLRLNLKK